MQKVLARRLVARILGLAVAREVEVPYLSGPPPPWRHGPVVGTVAAVAGSQGMKMLTLTGRSLIVRRCGPAIRSSCVVPSARQP